jgi:hypothetical protein
VLFIAASFPPFNPSMSRDDAQVAIDDDSVVLLDADSEDYIRFALNAPMRRPLNNWLRLVPFDEAQSVALKILLSDDRSSVVVEAQRRSGSATLILTAAFIYEQLFGRDAVVILSPSKLGAGRINGRTFAAAIRDHEFKDITDMVAKANKIRDMHLGTKLAQARLFILDKLTPDQLDVLSSVLKVIFNSSAPYGGRQVSSH